jgi:hypothetical protein
MGLKDFLEKLVRKKEKKNSEPVENPNPNP